MTPLLCLISVLPLSGMLSEEQILGEADARIEQHRTGVAMLRLLDQDGRPLAGGTKVRIEQTRHAFLFGSNIFMLDRYQDASDNEGYARHFADLLNFATLPFYWWSYEPQPGQLADDRTEHLARWCRGHDITVKGHPLAWNYRDPPWLPEEPDEVLKLQYARIGRNVSRFKDEITIWDVVNEATQHERPDTFQAPRLTRAISHAGVGEFVRQAFRTARVANPQATLIINDYRVDQQYIDNVINELMDESGEPMCDVIGIQSHQHGGAWPVRQIWEVCERFARFGKPLHFTETTFLSGEPGWDLKKKSDDPDFVWASTPEGERRQAEEVVRFYTILFSHPAVEAITWWDFSDKNAWQQAPAGFLRADMTPKPAYDELKKLIKGRWWTQVGTSVEDGGASRFRGFFGDYEVTVDGPDRPLTGRFRFDRTTRGPIEVRLK